MTTRRDFLKMSTIVGVTSLAGCLNLKGKEDSKTPLNEYTFKTIPEEHDIEGGNKVLMDFQNRNSHNIKPGQQIRLWDREKGDPIVLTLRTESPLDVPKETFMVSKEKMKLMGASEGDKVGFGREAPNSSISTVNIAQKNEEYIEQTIDNRRTDFALSIAPHGGQIEPFTDLQAKRVASKKFISSWVAMGYDDEGVEKAKDRWYVPASSIHKASYPQLQRTANKSYKNCVSFTGFRDDSISGLAVGIGGYVTNKEKQIYKKNIEEELEKHGGGSTTVFTYGVGDPNGPSPENISNRLTKDNRSGVEILQTKEVRQKFWQTIADGVQKALVELKG